MGVVLSSKEQEWVGRIPRAKEDDRITYAAFCDALEQQQQPEQETR